MPGKNLYEYAVIRVVPRVEREEFLNVGIVLFCASQKFLQAKYVVDKKRLAACCFVLDTAELEEMLHAITLICEGAVNGGPIGKLPLASRFRWLTAKRSTIVQTSPVHPGFCDDAGETLNSLFDHLVAQPFRKFFE